MPTKKSRCCSDLAGERQYTYMPHTAGDKYNREPRSNHTTISKYLWITFWTKSTSAFFFSKIHSRSSASVATTWSDILSYSASALINRNIKSVSFSSAKRKRICSISAPHQFIIIIFHHTRKESPQQVATFAVGFLFFLYGLSAKMLEGDNSGLDDRISVQTPEREHIDGRRIFPKQSIQNIPISSYAAVPAADPHSQ